MKKTLQELGTLAQAIIKELEVIDTKITELSAGNDAEALKTAKDVYAEKEQAFKVVEQEIEKAKELERKKAFALSVSQTLAPVQTEQRTPHVETTKDADAKEYLNIFTKFLRYERLDDNARNAMLPKSQNFQNKGSMEIAVAPELIKTVLLGKHIVKSMGTGGVVTNTTGSNLVDREFLAELLMEAMPVPQVVDRVRIIPTKSGDVEIPVLTQTDGSGKFGGLTFSRIQEGAAKPDTNATWTKVRIQTNELAGSMQVSERLLSRSMINVEQLLIEMSKSNLRYLLDTEILTGNGILECVGVINDAIRHVARNAVGTVSWADLLALKYAIPPEDRARGVFVLNDAVAYTLEGTTDLYGRPLFTPSVANGIYDRLVGFPYATNVNSPTLGAEGDVIFGDWSSYVLAMEEDVVIARSSDYAFVNNLMTYKAFMVVGGRPVLPRKFATLTVSAS